MVEVQHSMAFHEDNARTRMRDSVEMSRLCVHNYPNLFHRVREDLISRARAVGLCYPPKERSALDLPRYLIARTKGGKSRRQLQPVNFTCADQPTVVLELLALVYENNNLLLNLAKHFLLLDLEIFHLQTEYESTKSQFKAESKVLLKEMIDIHINPEFRLASENLVAASQAYRTKNEAIDIEVAFLAEMERLHLFTQEMASPFEGVGVLFRYFETYQVQITKAKARQNANTAKYLDLCREVQSIRKAVDEAAAQDCEARKKELDRTFSKTLKDVLVQIRTVLWKMKTIKNMEAYYKKEIESCEKDIDFADELNLLGAPIQFFRFPPEIRNNIYSSFLVSAKAIDPPKFTHPNLFLLGLGDANHTNMLKVGTEISEDDEEIDYDHVQLPIKPLRSINAALSVSRRFREEAGGIYYRDNIFTCRCLYRAEQDLGLKIIQPNYKNAIQTVHLAWDNLGRSTVSAVAALESLKGLKEIHIYINFKHIIRHGVRSREGVESFQRLVKGQAWSSVPEIKVFLVALTGRECIPSTRDFTTWSHKGIRQGEIKANEMLSNRLVIQPKNHQEWIAGELQLGDLNDRFFARCNRRRYHSGGMKLLTGGKLDKYLERVLEKAENDRHSVPILYRPTQEHAFARMGHSTSALSRPLWTGDDVYDGDGHPHIHDVELYDLDE